MISFSGFMQIAAPARATSYRRSSLLGCLALSLSALVMGGVGCAGDATPTVSIVTPAENATVCGKPFHVKVALTDFTLVPDDDEGEEGEEPTPGSEPTAVSTGEGHVHVFLNSKYVDQLVTEEADLYDPVEDGDYQLKVSLVNADHTKVDPVVDDFIYVTVDNSLCASAVKTARRP